MGGGRGRDFGGEEEGRGRGMWRTYVVEHFVAGFEAFGGEEIFEGFLLLARDG